MKMKCPEGVTSVSFNGETFEANRKGIVDVPHTALTALSELGLVAVPDPRSEVAPEPEPVPETGEEGAQ
jgi:hypothetical protein